MRSAGPPSVALRGPSRVSSVPFRGPGFMPGARAFSPQEVIRERCAQVLGRRSRRPHQALTGPLGRRLRSRERASRRRDARQRHPQPPERRPLPQLLPPSQRSERRRPHGTPHVHLLVPEGGHRAHQQLDGPARGPHQGRFAVRRRDARAHHVCDPVRHGTARLAVQQGGRRDHGQPLRGRQHADHDTHGRRREPPARQLGRLREGSALARRFESRAALHLPLSGDEGDLERRVGLRRQRAPRQEVLRTPDRQRPGARRGLVGRAHADPRPREPRGRDDVHRRGVPERLRQDEPRHARPARVAEGLEGVDRRRRHRLAASRPRRSAVGDQPRGRLLRRRARHVVEDQPERDGDPARQRDLHQRRGHRRRLPLVGRASTARSPSI